MSDANELDLSGIKAEAATPAGPEIEALDAGYKRSDDPKDKEMLAKLADRVIRTLTGEQVKPGTVIAATPKMVIFALEKGRHPSNDGTGYVSILFVSGEVRVYRILKFITPEPASEAKPEGMAGNDYAPVDYWTPDGMF